MILIKSTEYADFDLSWSGLQLLGNNKPIRKLACKVIIRYLYTIIHEVYTILFSRDLKKQKLGLQKKISSYSRVRS